MERTYTNIPEPRYVYRAQTCDESGGVTPESLLEKMEAGSGISVDLNEEETAVAVAIDMTGAGTSQDSGKVLTADGQGGCAWQYPSASNFNSGSATSGQFLVANGSGGASWQTVASANGVSF